MSTIIFKKANKYRHSIQLSVEYNDDEPALIRVKFPEFLNISAIDYSCLLFDFFGDWFLGYNKERVLWGTFDYDEADIQTHFNDYTYGAPGITGLEQSLINGQIGPCPDADDHN